METKHCRSQYSQHYAHVKLSKEGLTQQIMKARKEVRVLGRGVPLELVQKDRQRMGGTTQVFYPWLSTQGTMSKRLESKYDRSKLQRDSINQSNKL